MDSTEADIEETTWTADDAIELYRIDRWGSGYFGVDGEGNLTVAPLKEMGATIPIPAVIEEALEQGLKAPLLLRFQDLLRHRVEKLNRSFQNAIAENRYQNEYRGVFPIKVNQLREVVEEILDAGAPYHYGIEVGSKPEIFAGPRDPLRSRVADHLQRLQGRRVHPHGADRTQARQEGHPRRREALGGPRDHLASRRRWASSRGSACASASSRRARATGPTSGGEHAKFGLSTSEILEAIDAPARRRDGRLVQAPPLPHRLADPRHPDRSSAPCARRRATTRSSSRRGIPLDYLDVGGGLAIDYDGSRSTFHSSMNYTVEEYARDIVYNIMDICDEEQVPHPHIVSESGRAIVAHHSVLVVEAFGAIEKTPVVRAGRAARRDHKLVDELLDIREPPQRPQPRRVVARPAPDQGGGAEDVRARPPRARREGAHRDALLADRRGDSRADRQQMDPAEVPEDLAGAPAASSPTSTSATSRSSSRCSITGRSAQLFPIVPIHRLDERPTVESTLVDITCDSDGKVSQVHRSATTCATRCRSTRIDERPVLPRHLPDRRLPGHHGRHPQPLRPRQRGPRLPRRRRGERLLPRGDDRREHHRRGPRA